MNELAPASLRDTVAESRRDLDAALVALERVLLERVSLGRRLAENRWWMIGAVAIGFYWGARSRR
jgi:hypothetical protein